MLTLNYGHTGGLAGDSSGISNGCAAKFRGAAGLTPSEAMRQILFVQIMILLGSHSRRAGSRLLIFDTEFSCYAKS